MKVILMIDKPTDCSKCPVREIFFDSDWNIKQGIRHMSCRLNLDRATEIGKGIPVYCPLKPLPQKKILDEELFMYGNFRIIQARFTGWNDCIDEILGEEE